MLAAASIRALRDIEAGWQNPDSVVIGSYDQQYSPSDSANETGKPQNMRYSRYDNADNLGITNESTATQTVMLLLIVPGVGGALEAKMGMKLRLQCTAILSAPKNRF